MYIKDVKTTGGPAFSLAKLSNSRNALLWQHKIVITYQGKMKASEKNHLFAAKVLRDQTVTQELRVNKTNNLAVFFTSEETTFDLSANCEGITARNVKQGELDTFFTREFLTNENILRILEKDECDIDDCI